MTDYYTHPSMPGAPATAFNLSAALEDAEGRALVDAIITLDNPRLTRESKALERWGDLFLEPGYLIPLEATDGN